MSKFYVRVACSAKNKLFNANGYWKGSTWIDQVWFAYTGLKTYAVAPAPPKPVWRHGQDSVDLRTLAHTIKQRTLSVGQGFAANDTTPLNEHCVCHFRPVFLIT